MNEDRETSHTAGFSSCGGSAAGLGIGNGAGFPDSAGDVLPRAEKLRGEAESLLERLIALLHEASLLAESLRDATGDGERAAFLCGELGAVTRELAALNGRMRKCLDGLPGVGDMAALARILDRGEEGPLTARLELVGKLASEVLQLQTANEKLFFLLSEGLERYLCLLAEALGGWMPYDRCGLRRWALGWKKKTLYST